MRSSGAEAETDPTVIAQNIEETRRDMTVTIDAIQHRLEPEQVTEYVKEVAHYVILEVKDAVRDLAGQARGAIQESTAKKKDEWATSARASATSGQATRTGDQAKQKAGQVTGQMQAKAGQVSEQMQEKAGEMQQQAQGFWKMLESNPIAIGALGVALGGIAAAIVPATEKENQLMGETRDRVLGSVQEVAGEAVENVKSVAAEAGNSVMEEAKAQADAAKRGGKSGASA